MEQHRRDIEHLIFSYAEHVDGGDFGAVGELLADAAYIGGMQTARGRQDIEKMFRDMVILYDDGTPRTKHVTTNVIIDVAEDATHASARSYFTALQAVPGLALQPIAAGRYHDRFERRDGRWRFIERRVHVDLAGDLVHHLRDVS